MLLNTIMSEQNNSAIIITTAVVIFFLRVLSDVIPDYRLRLLVTFPLGMVADQEFKREANSSLIAVPTKPSTLCRN